MKLVLALAGGGIKGVFQIAVLKAIFDHPYSKNIVIVNIYSSSVGSLVSPFILTKQFDKALSYIRNLSSLDDISIRWNSINIWPLNELYGYYNLIFNKSYYKSIDTKILKELKNNISVEKNNEIASKLHCHVFNVSTGKEELLSGSNWIDNIEASIAIPLLYPRKKINNSYYVDGAVSSRLAVDNIMNDDTDILMINFKKDIYQEEKTDINKLNTLEYVANIICQSAELHVLNDYEQFIQRIDTKRLHKISMETKFDNALDFNKYLIEFAIQEGYDKGRSWINSIAS